MPRLHRITIYPVKSLDGVVLDEVEVLAAGALARDREYAILDSRGHFVNGKRNERVHLLRLEADLAECRIRLRAEGETESHLFHLEHDRSRLEQFLSDFFGMKVSVARNSEGGFPDDTEASGPTIISTETLRTISEWFPRTSLDELRRRFRANLEIGNCDPFWEDCLYAEAGRPVRFQIGEVAFEGLNPSQRCAVPTRDSFTGQPDPTFAHTFAVKRREALPPWANVSRFDHYYRLAVNTRVPPTEAAKILRSGDPVSIQET